MYKILLMSVALLSIGSVSQAQIVNRDFFDNNTYLVRNQPGIKAAGNVININCQVGYNAVPDGYFATYTTTYIGSNVEEVESLMNQKMDDLRRDVKRFGVKPEQMLVDVISLDPIFDIQQRTETQTTEPTPSGYKITQNISFNLTEIEQFRKVSTVCLSHGIYDVISIRAYLNSSKEVYDTLALKAVEVLEHKKKLAKDLGWSFTNGEASFSKTKDVLYPNERYLKSHLRNSSFYKHHLTQNSDLKVERKLSIDNHYVLDLEHADFVFNANETVPVIQFFYYINYSYVKKDSEAEIREQIRAEMDEENRKTFYILDRDGKLQELRIE